MLALHWDYLMGKAVASAWSSERHEPEWPPHPDRVFQALVAAWAETGAEAGLRDALLWLERLPPPLLCIPQADACSERPVFVPVNDIECSPRTKKYGNPMLSLLPAQRHKAQRFFPALTVHGHCALCWRDETPTSTVYEALKTLCERVTHVGHSSSLVRMWVGEAALNVTHRPVPMAAELSLRVPYPGRLDVLVDAFADGGEQWARPPAAQWQGYVEVNADVRISAMPVFGSNWTVLRRVAGAVFGLGQAPAVAEALRGALTRAADGDATALELISGHAPNGSPSQKPHVAFVPLGFVGYPHADGRLLGMAVVLPRQATYDERDTCLRTLVMACDADTDELTLTFGAAGTMTLAMEEREQPPHTLQSATWCRPSIRWASVTPIALDRLPPRRCVDRELWAGEQVVAACVRIGLPVPAAVHILPTSRFIGAPSCKAFPPLPRRSDGGPRWHVHAEIVFSAPVHGPLLLGSGRYRGYGICRPFFEEDVS